MKLVVIESPYAGDVDRNVKYARACMKDCFERNEAPFVSHLLYTQEGVLDDNVAEERKKGMEAGFLWGDKAEKTVVYTDLGISNGMKEGIVRAVKVGRKIEYRSLIEWAINDDFIKNFCEEMGKKYQHINRGENYQVALDPSDKMATLFHNRTSGGNYSNITYRDVAIVEGVGNYDNIAVCDYPALLFNDRTYVTQSRMFTNDDFHNTFGFGFCGFTRRVLTEKKKKKTKYIIHSYRFNPEMNSVVLRYVNVEGEQNNAPIINILQ